VLSKKKIGVGILLFVTLIFLLCLVNAFRFQSKQIKVKQSKQYRFGDSSNFRLGEAIRFKTITTQESNRIDSIEFFKFHNFLTKSYPFVHRHLRLEKINGLSLLYKWEGTNNSLRPILLMSHQDVVPVEPSSFRNGQFEPFSGKASNGFIYGRGTLDVKTGIVSQLEAIEFLLKNGFKPQRTIYLAYGHDEEIGGHDGAKKIAALLLKQGEKLDFVLDEGGSIVSGSIPGLSKPVALVGIAEKGYVSLKLSVNSKGGHSSMPPKQTAIGVLSAALTKIEKNPFQKKLKGAGALLFEYLAPEMGFKARIAFSNQWLFAPLIENKLDLNNATRALLQTTSAETIISGGNKENVLPTEAKAIINLRILPGESITSVKQHVKEVINDKRVKISTSEHFVDEPSDISDPHSKSFRKLQSTISSCFHDVLVAPYLTLGSTDARHYGKLTKNIYRFVPFRLSKSDLSRIHGINERISIVNYHESINFYIHLIRNSTKN
jgi:carboxypeptidase PM20D1